MEKKCLVIGIFICILLISIIIPAAGIELNIENNEIETYPISASDAEWCLQWVKKYGSYRRTGGLSPIGDIDEDGKNEIIISGDNKSEHGECCILSYDEKLGTYIEEYSWFVKDPDGNNMIEPWGICIIDLDDDGDLEFCVAWYNYYVDIDGLFAYDWDGETFTELDFYNGSGFNWVRVTLACDYDDDGDVELILGNYPEPPGPGDKHITALGWDNENEKFIEEAFWTLHGYEDRSSTIKCGDTDNDGKTEIIVTLTGLEVTKVGTWVLNWNENIGEWEEEVISTDYTENSPKGIDIGDLNGNGIPEIIIGTWFGYPEAWLYEWNGEEYEEIWNKKYTNDYPVDIDYAVAIGDADNDGINELCVATNKIYIYQWDGSRYKEEAKIDTNSIESCSWLNIGDCDSDGLNELKTCSSEGKEYIYKFQKPPMAPMITGPERVKPGIEYDYSFMSTDPEDDFLSYYIDWGDGTSDGWTDYSDSGEEITLSHTWDKMKLFNFIRCRARDNNGGISDWSKYWVPINKETSQIHILRFFKDFPLLNWLLNYVKLR